MSFKIPISVYIIWHPNFVEGQQIADKLYSLLCRDTQKPLVRSIGIPVYYRCTNYSNLNKPKPIEFEESEYTAIVPLISDHLLIDSEYKDFVNAIFDECAQIPSSRRMFPISLSENAYKINEKIGAINFIRAHSVACQDGESTIDTQTNHIKSMLFHELCRLLMNMKSGQEEVETISDTAASPVKLFISHSKHDESVLEATKFRDHINSNTQLKTFFDANDIGYGYDFGNEIKKAARESALVVFQSDSYSDREWCRTEVITAKSFGCPIVIVNALQKGEKRTFPYLGNSPSIRFNNNFQDIIDLTLEQVLFNLFSKKVLSQQAELYGLDVDFVLSNYPELFSFIDLKQKNKTKGLNFSVVIYPDPPLGTEETTILNEMDDAFHFVTPVMLSTINSSK